jgi:hypothetical protein
MSLSVGISPWLRAESMVRMKSMTQMSVQMPTVTTLRSRWALTQSTTLLRQAP